MHTFTVDSVTLLVLPAHLRLLLESLDAAAPSSLPIELSKLNVSLSSRPLANSSSTVTLLSFGFSQPLNLLTSFLPSPLSSQCFQCVGPAEAPVGDTHREGTETRSWLQIPVHIEHASQSPVRSRNSAGKELGELE